MASRQDADIKCSKAGGLQGGARRRRDYPVLKAMPDIADDGMPGRPVHDPRGRKCGRQKKGSESAHCRRGVAKSAFSGRGLPDGTAQSSPLRARLMRQPQSASSAVRKVHAGSQRMNSRAARFRCRMRRTFQHAAPDCNKTPRIRRSAAAKRCTADGKAKIRTADKSPPLLPGSRETAGCAHENQAGRQCRIIL